jgi:hypothetical protein
MIVSLLFSDASGPIVGYGKCELTAFGRQFDSLQQAVGNQIVCLERFPSENAQTDDCLLKRFPLETHKQQIVYGVNNYVNNFSKQLAYSV